MMEWEELSLSLKYLSSEDLGKVKKAWDFAHLAHQGQKRVSGEMYITHPIAVTALLAEMHLDAATLAAALLHDVVEDTEIDTNKISDEFGKEIAKLVEGVTKLSRIHVRSDEMRQAENIRKMLLAMAEDVRVVLIKLADRLHNLQTIASLPEERQRRIARETLDIFAPLAHRLGIGGIKVELEERAFAVLEPGTYKGLEDQLDKEHSMREEVLKDLCEKLTVELKGMGISASVTGRPKNIYSVWEKIQRGKELNEIYDLLAVRVLVEEVSDCYMVLGAVHSLYKPMPGRFKDYIATSKSNGYASLHTTVVSGAGTPIEVQIRTNQMHQQAEYGVAAHWLYKGGGVREDPQWLKLLMEWQREVADEHFVESVKADILQEDVFTFSPKGDVVPLPMGSTPIDFAYRIHSEVGKHCSGAKVNNKMVGLDFELSHGDIVEIITSKNATPKRDWLRIVRSAAARGHIRRYLKSQSRSENLQRGREALDQELHRLRRLSLALVETSKLEEVAKAYHYNSVDDLLAAIGYGEASAQGVAGRLPLLAEEDDLKKIPLKAQRVPTAKVLVMGQSDIYAQIATCCQPLPGNKIIGFVTRGKGVTVHRHDCSNVVGQSKSGRFIVVEWDTKASISYPIRLRISGNDRTGLLRDLTGVVAEAHVSLTKCTATIGADGAALINIEVEVDSLEHLASVIEQIEKIKGVSLVTREK